MRNKTIRFLLSGTEEAFHAERARRETKLKEEHLRSCDKLCHKVPIKGTVGRKSLGQAAVNRQMSLGSILKGNDF